VSLQFLSQQLPSVASKGFPFDRITTLFSLLEIKAEAVEVLDFHRDTWLGVIDYDYPLRTRRMLSNNNTHAISHVGGEDYVYDSAELFGYPNKFVLAETPRYKFKQLWRITSR
jgi:hypothetical protein